MRGYVRWLKPIPRWVNDMDWTKIWGMVRRHIWRVYEPGAHTHYTDAPLRLFVLRYQRSCLNRRDHSSVPPSSCLSRWLGLLIVAALLITSEFKL